jgi:hypothetical protein
VSPLNFDALKNINKKGEFFMSLFDAIGITPLFGAIESGVNRYLNNIDCQKFAHASLPNQLLRTTVGVVGVAAAAVALKATLSLGAAALCNAPFPLLLSAVAIISSPFTAGLSLVLFFPVALYSLPALIQTTGAIIAASGTLACGYLSAKSFSFI